jgi:plastocyanin
MSTATTSADTHHTGAATRQLSWRRLLWAAAAADLVAILVFAAAAGDLEAAAIGAGFGVGLALLRWRTGLAGKLLLSFLFADILVWMVMGTVTNIRAGERLGTVLVPAALTGVSVTGFIAAVAGLRRREGPGANLAAALGVTIIVVATIAAIVTPTSAVGAADLRIVSEKVRFDQTTVRAPAGQLTVELANRDLFWHTFTIDELGVDLAVPVGGDRQVSFQAQPGTYRFYCRIPGHEARMNGTLTVR